MNRESYEIARLMGNLQPDGAQCSFYPKPITNIKPEKVIPLPEVFQRITDDGYKAITEEIRGISDRHQRNKAKATKLDFVIFSSLSKQRKAGTLQEHSGLICLDIDDVNNPAELKHKALGVLPALMFVSPSGKGLKIVYRIDMSAGGHDEYFKALHNFSCQQLGVAPDKSGKDVTRACFLSHDPEAEYFPESPVLGRPFLDTFLTENKPVSAETSPVEGDFKNDIIRIASWLSGKMTFEEGNRNNYIKELSGAFNRAGIPMEAALDYCLKFEEESFPDSEIIRTVKSMYSNTQMFGINPLNAHTAEEDFRELALEGATPLLSIDGFPELLRNFINTYVRIYGIPRDYMVAAVIIATALAIGDKLELIDKYRNIPILWMVLVGNVSAGKTEALKVCLEYFQKKDNDAYKLYRLEMELYNSFMALPKADRAKGPSQQRPCYFQYILGDYTPESLVRIHEKNGRGICVYRDELKGWIDSFGRYTGGSSGEQSAMLSTFTREAMVVNRAGKEPARINKPAIYVAGGIQPDLLPSLAEDKRAESGFLSRFIFAFPDSAEKPKYREGELPPGLKESFFDYLDGLASIKEYHRLTLSGDAKQVYKSWFNENVDRSNKETSGYLKGVYGKLDIIALRLAIVVHGMTFKQNDLIFEENDLIISGKTMETAVSLTEYFRATALKVYNVIFWGKTDKGVSTKEAIKYLLKAGKGQREIARILDVNPSYVNKVFKKSEQ